MNANDVEALINYELVLNEFINTIKTGAINNAATITNTINSVVLFIFSRKR